jgi:phosphatidylserine/phosphatidylglycerophosphate/cardiolipin synthase-like enzyme
MPYTINWINGTWTAYSGIARQFTTEIKTTYESLIGSATNFLLLENQYFRHLDIAERVRNRLDAAGNLQVVIILPAYAEEIGQRSDLPSLRERYVAETDATKKAKLLADARAKGLTIDPFNKLTLWMTVTCLGPLVVHPRASIWIPRIGQGKIKAARPYIHSKLCVQDDDAIFVGSANINGRSLDGFTDSEINLLLTSTTEVQRIKAARKWANVPTDEKDPRYARWSGTDPTPSYYAKTNLVRYRPAHLEIDRAFAAFPVGKAALLTYWDTFTGTASRRVSGWLGGVTRSDMAHAWDKLESLKPVVDPEQVDWGEFLADQLGHLL